VNVSTLRTLVSRTPPNPFAGLRARVPTRLRGHGIGRAVELAAFAFAAPLIGRLLFPDDPLGLDSGFPWAALGPIVVAARYGVGAGLVCALLAIATFALPLAVYTARTADVATLAIGTLLLSVIVGDSAGAWRRRGLRAEAENDYLSHRLEEFSNDYHVLKVSHGQLEEFVAGQRKSLRGALLELRPAFAGGAGEAGGLGDGSELMAVFAQFCSVQVAGLYAMKSDALVDPVPLAVHGDMGELPVFDPLLRLALTERRLASVRPEAAAAEQNASTLLAAVPIVDSRDRLHGVLAVRDMHFMAFQQTNLNLLALLAGYVGDMIARGGGLGDAPAERFVAELDTVVRFARSHAVRSALLRLRFVPHERRDEITTFVANGIRGLDASWIVPAREGGSAFATVVLLLPLVGERGADAWMRRTARAVRERFDVELTDLLVSSRILQIGAGHTRGDAITFIGAGDGSAEAGLPFGTGEPAERIDHVA